MNRGQIYPNYLDMGGAPVDMMTIKDGTTATYDCMALTGTATSPSDKKFKIIRQITNGTGGKNISFAYNMEGILLTYTPVSGTFKVGETIAGTSGTAKIVWNSASNSMAIDDTTGTFATSDTITGDISGATATVDLATDWAIKKWGYKYELAATNLALLQSYNYAF